MTLHLNFPHHRHGASTSTAATAQAQEVREARRFLKDRVRNDWDFPTLPAWRSSGRERRRSEQEDVEDRIAGFRFHVPGERERERTTEGRGEVLGLEFDPLEWRERVYSSNEDEADTDGEGETPNSATTPTGKTSGKGRTYKFEGPDSVGRQLSDRRMKKKRKRFAALEQEMEWNDGLAHWMRRRDAWSCARTATQVNFAGTANNDGQPTAADSASTSSSSPRSSTSSSFPQNTASTPGSSPSTTPDLTAIRANTTTTQTVISPAEVLVPIAPPLLPNHPVRRKITPNMYPEIYTKIILQSRTPSVPINLQTLVHALVQGWKDDGEWPPKSAPLEKSIGRKRGSHSSGLREGVKAVGRVLRLTGTSEVGRGEG